MLAPPSTESEQVWRKTMKMMTKPARKADGATAIEYGLIAMLIAVAIITVVSQFEAKAPAPKPAQVEMKK